MVARRCLVLCFALFVVSGCRSTANQELLERELRLQEDKIFALERLLADCEDGLACYDKDRRAPPVDASASRRRTRAADDNEDAYEPEPRRTRPPAIELPEIDIPDDSTPLAPRIDIDESDAAPPFRPPVISPLDVSPIDEAPPFSPKPPARSSSRSELPAPPARKPASLDLNPQSDDGELIPLATGGHAVVESITLRETANDSATAEGVHVVVEPRDVDGNVVEAPGKMSIVVLDPSKTGDEARAARWDLTEDQVAIFIQNAGEEPAIHLDLPWPGEQPTHADLKLYVRYVAADGRKITVDRDMRNAIGASPRDESGAKERTVSSPAGADSKSSRRITKPTWSPYR